MKIVLDTRVCNCWDPACETHFAWHFLRGQVTPVDCVVSMEEDGSSELSFFITDRDGSQKALVVTDENRADVYNSWRIAWEKQEQEKQG
jgi:hypothetical protein